ncbi:MAG: hypothetical protein RIQ60_460 [Pseudomonadota bacterium]|jgi:peroxiredoxin
MSPAPRRRRPLLALPALLLCIGLAGPARAALAEGDPAPGFSTLASLAGKPYTYTLRSALSAGPVVVYFFPSAFTAACNMQAHEFSVLKEQFSAAGASIVGVSLDNIQRLNEFSANPDFCAGKFAVASDPDGRIARSYGLKVNGVKAGAKDTRGLEIDHGFAERTTFIVGRDGTVRAVVGGVSPQANVQRTLELVQGLKSDGNRP